MKAKRFASPDVHDVLRSTKIFSYHFRIITCKSNPEEQRQQGGKRLGHDAVDWARIRS